MCRSLAASLLALFALNAYAATFQVTRTNDPSPNGCLPGDCSLREAMEAAQANDPAAGPDIVVMPSGNYTLTDSLEPVSQGLNVQGAGSDLTRIVLDVEFTDVFKAAAGGEIVLAGLSLDTAGTAVDGCYAGFQGVPMSLDDVVFEDGNFLSCGAATVRRSEVRNEASTASPKVSPRAPYD